MEDRFGFFELIFVIFSIVVDLYTMEDHDRLDWIGCVGRARKSILVYNHETYVVLLYTTVSK